LQQALARFLRRVAKQAALDDAVAFAALSKTDASDDLPKLRDVLIRLAVRY